MRPSSVFQCHRLWDPPGPSLWDGIWWPRYFLNSEGSAGGGFLFDILAVGLLCPSGFCFVSYVIYILHETTWRGCLEFWGLWCHQYVDDTQLCLSLPSKSDEAVSAQD